MLDKTNTQKASQKLKTKRAEQLCKERQTTQET